jgi:hypothetical protein
MSKINQPILETKKIVIATVSALLLGSIIVIGAVLPAEYGIDPTGIGQQIGFDKLYKPVEKSTATSLPGAVVQSAIKVLKLEGGGSEPEVIKPEEANYPAPAVQYEERSDSVQVSLKAGKGLEYKVKMLKYGRLKYEWLTSNGIVYADFHGDVKQANPPKDIYYESYAIAYSNNMIGNLLTPYEGRHGWYFKNMTGNDITISIRLKGQYALEANNKH